MTDAAKDDPYVDYRSVVDTIGATGSCVTTYNTRIRSRRSKTNLKIHDLPRAAELALEDGATDECLITVNGNSINFNWTTKSEAESGEIPF